MGALHCLHPVPGVDPFQVGLFNGMRVEFEKPIYMAALLSGLLLLACAVLYFKTFRLDGQRDLLPSPQSCSR